MKYTSINIQGNLISEEILQKIEEADIQGQTAKDFGFEQGITLRSEIEYAWSRIKLDWKHYLNQVMQLPTSDPYGTTMTRKWMSGFFSSLGFELTIKKVALTGDNDQNYFISHTSDNLDQLPLHIVGFHDPTHPNRNTLEIRSSGGTSRLSPHATVQEYLNVTEHLYALVSNGFLLRLVRDSGHMVKLTYIEVNLKRLLEEDLYSEFSILFRLLHASRFPKTMQEAENCLLEGYYQESIEAGNRIRDKLSEAVCKSLVALGNGFILNEGNSKLRSALVSGELSVKEYNRQLLRLIYRLLFLMVIEERDLIYDPDNKDEDQQKKKGIYIQYYSIHRLRNLSQKLFLYEKKYNDLWMGLLRTFRIFEEGSNGISLGIAPLAGDLFNSRTIAGIESYRISNQLLLECIRNLNEFEDEQGNLVTINYRALDVEELGSVYEGLLDLHPVVEGLTGDPGHAPVFRYHEGTDRKTTGSYYTRPDLVNELIRSALEPVIKERLEQHAGKPEEQEKELLGLKICDPAAGSGHMLLAASRTIAWYLARTRTGEDNPSPSIYRTALREVIQHCIYAVDMNPDAVELCKLSLWLESHNSGKPISFLDHKIKCGNSLVGVSDLGVLDRGIPDGAYIPVSDDDKAIASALKKENHKFLVFLSGKKDVGFQQSIGFEGNNEMDDITGEYNELESIQQDNLDAVNKVREKYEHLRSNRKWYNDWTACNIWTAAFFHKYCSETIREASLSEHLHRYRESPTGVFDPLIGKANQQGITNRFFHWPLEFPDVFEKGGFDIMLGNPPWEKIQVEEISFFKTRDKEISELVGAKRKKKIEELKDKNPELYDEFLEYKREIISIDKFIKNSSRYPLTGNGKMNTYSLFTEIFSSYTNSQGSSGIIVPLGIATDDNNKLFFSELIKSNRLVTVYGFENEEFIFSDVHHSFKFVLLTINGSERTIEDTKFAFFCRQPNHLIDKNRAYKMSISDLINLNPNTVTSPIFRTSADANINVKIYRKFPILCSENTNRNLWNVSIHRMLNPTDDSSSMIEYSQFINQRHSSIGFTILSNDIEYYPVYEAKMIYKFDHRFGTYEGQTTAQKNQRKLPEVLEENHINCNYQIKFNNYVSEDFLNKFVENKTDKNWLFAYRDVTSAVVTNTSIACIIPKFAAVDPCRIIYFNEIETKYVSCFLGMFNSLVFDYLSRQKVSGNHLAIFVLKQLPVIPIENYVETEVLRINRLILELVYTSWDIKPYADDLWNEADDTLKTEIKLQWDENKANTGNHHWSPPEWCKIDEKGCPLPPFKWDEDRRAVLKAELDAFYAKLYGLNTDELRYILDPLDVYGPDFPGETFRVLKEKEIKHYGEYRTKRLVLEAWQKLNEEMSIAQN